jgi:hypothetical protein
MLKRRTFLLFTSLLGLSPYLHAKEISTFTKAFKSVEQTISSVQAHLFPEGGKLPSAKAMNLSTFLFETVKHKSYDRDIRAFVIEGAKELELREKGKFTTLSTPEKEKALRAYEETNYGSSWLSRMMTLGMEGLFSDPIYGSNINEAGWKALGSYGGFPRPKTKYMQT